jgi:hypothetical protein
MGLIFILGLVQSRTKEKYGTKRKGTQKTLDFGYDLLNV